MIEPEFAFGLSFTAAGTPCVDAIGAALRARCVATTLVSTDRAISAGVCAPMGTPAGAMIASTDGADAPLAFKFSF